MNSLLNKIGMAALIAASVTAADLPAENYVYDKVVGTVDLLQEMFE